MLKTELSVIIPIYNTEKFLEDCISSVLQLEDISYEIILIDDGSTDNSSKICESYQKSYPNKIIYHKQKNCGQGYARNIGLKKSKGEYVFFLDSDDLIIASEFVKVFKIAKDKRLDLVIFEGDSFFDRNYTPKSKSSIAKSYKRKNKYTDEIYKGMDILKKLVNNKDYYASPSLYLTKRSHITDNKINFLEGCIHEDEFFSPLNIILSNKIQLTHFTVLKRRLRTGSTMTSINHNVQKSIDGNIRVVASLYQFKTLLHEDVYEKIILKRYSQVLVQIFRYNGFNFRENLGYLRNKIDKLSPFIFLKYPKFFFVYITAYYLPWILKISIKLIDFKKMRV